MASTPEDALWLNYIPIPRMLELAVQELGKEKDLPFDSLERILPVVCFSLPPNSSACTKLLLSLPPSSSVWDRLEEGLLSSHKYLPPEILVTLYQQRPSVLESRIFQVFIQYTQSTSACEEYSTHEGYNLSNYTVEHFKSRRYSPPGASDKKFESRGVESKETLSKIKLTCNLWHKSGVVDVAVLSESVFTLCLKIFFKLAVDSQFSSTYILGVSDFFSILFHELDRDLFKVFPSSMQHIAYLLTLPLNIPVELNPLEDSVHIQCVQDALLELLRDDGVVMVRSLLCFFPYWLVILSRNQFLEKYLKFSASRLCTTYEESISAR